MRTRGKYAAAVAAIVSGAIAVAGAGGATKSAGPDLSTPRAVKSYLRSIGVAPAKVVWQRGQRNYVGRHCPGRGWNCTTATRVVQIATDGGKNVGECTGSTVAAPGQTCVIFQTGTENTARCVEKATDPVAAQHCTITQTGDRNEAFVEQDVGQNGAATQSATQTADVTQTATQKNELHLRQDAGQRTSTGPTQTEDAHQAATVDQTATDAGNNYAQVNQSQLQKEFGGSAQRQNTTLPTIPDCDPSFPSATHPNGCANIEQHADAGNNDLHLRQSIDEDAKSGVVATQQQQLATGGLDGRVHQDTVTGRSLNDADQSKHQKLSGAPGSAQTQFDPIGCCGAASQVGGTGNMDDVDQSSSQDATEGLAFQQSTLIGQSVTPTGTCTISQHARNNADTASTAQAQSPCPFFQITTACTSVPTETGAPCVTASTTTPPCITEICEIFPPVVAARLG